MIFKDHFSDDPAYARFRPTYPLALFTYLASLVPGHDKAWDCATGTGQAARSLARFFDRVIATDASKEQISRAGRSRGITYRAETAERTDIENGTIDLITVAQALHWFNIPEFFREADRVLKKSGILAVWSYDLLEISPAIDEVIRHFYSAVLGKYWPAERELVEERYSGIEFPFSELPSPRFEMEVKWNLDQLMGYIGTWSAARRYMKDRGEDPMPELRRTLLPLWGDPRAEVTIRWPLTVIVRRKPDPGFRDL